MNRSTNATIRDYGEKRLIAEFIWPLFNRDNKLGGVGDDCAMIDPGDGTLWLFSTDRVPADLTAFRLGLLDHEGLGRYLACLNLSDIAACGGQPLALLLNLGLPDDLLYDDFVSLCTGFGRSAEQHRCEVLGGDMTWSNEISISATAIGRTSKAGVLSRRGARPGDSVFISKPLGLTPAALTFFRQEAVSPICLSESDRSTLRRQFSAMEPELDLGQQLSASGQCTCCMDNTDGIGQSLTELSQASGVQFVVDGEVRVPPLVNAVAQRVTTDATTLAFSGGADFGLVGTLRGAWKEEVARAAFGSTLSIIGHVESGAGLVRQVGSNRVPLEFSGWNYFSGPSSRPGSR